MRGHVHPVVWESTGDGWDNDFPEEQQTGIMSFIQEGLTGCSRRTGATGARWQTTQDIQSSVSAIENTASSLWADADYYFICLAVGNATARRAGIVICKGNHPSWWEACLRVWLTDWVNEWSLKCVLAGVCLLFFQKSGIIHVGGRARCLQKFKFSLKWKQRKIHLCAKMMPSSTCSLTMSAVLHKYSWQGTFGRRSGSAAAGSWAE